MKIITRYLLSEFLKFFSLSLLALTGVFLVIDFFERLDNFNNFHASGQHIALFFLYELPRVIFLLLPVAVLLSTILCIGLLSKNSEIIAMRAGGISLYRISLPILITAFILSMLSFIANESLVPFANRQATYVKERLIEKKPPRGILQSNKIWLKLPENRILNVEYMDIEKGVLSGVSVFSFDNMFNIRERIEARALEWKDGQWLLRGGKRYTLKSGEATIVEPMDGVPYPIREKPKVFKELEIIPDEMSFVQLNRYIDSLKAKGHNVNRYSADLHGKIAFVLVTFIMALVAVPFSLRNARSSGLGAGVGLSLLLGFSYWVLFSMSLSFAHAGTLPPIFAAWLSNIIFTTGGLYLLFTVRQ